jgi:hypothetical protein
MSLEFIKIKAKKFALIGCCLVVIAAVKLALGVIRFRNLRRFLPRGANDKPPLAMCLRIAEAVSTAARWVPGASCLPQALAAQIMLALRGYSSELQVGVRIQDDGRFGAHAWLTCSDRVVIGGSQTELGRFEPLIELLHH